MTKDELTLLLKTTITHQIERRGKAFFPFRDHFPFLLLLARTGVRLGEALAIKWGDVDWNGGFIHVQREYVRGEISAPKSGHDRRVDMSDQL